MTIRMSTVERKTSETSVRVTVHLDGDGVADVNTGIGFLDHMLSALSRHARMTLTMSCVGDLQVDDHHTSEDCALALGTAIDQALGQRSGFARFGSAYAPLDESLARAVIDLSGRPACVVNLGIKREMLGNWATENISQFFVSLSTTLRCAIHIDVIRGENDHHRVEAAFKAFALALRIAMEKTPDNQIPSTKGVL